MRAGARHLLTVIPYRFFRVRLMSGFRLPLSLRLALRELRGGARGFRIFVVCIALSVASIAGVGALSQALQESLRREGRSLLGGDVEVNLIQRRISLEERSFLAGEGVVSEVASLRAMARRKDGASQALVDLKAVDGLYPLHDTVALEGGASLGSAIGVRGGVAVAPALLEQLGVKVGDSIRIGAGDFVITSVIAREPDHLSGGVGFGVRVMMSLESLAATELDRPGGLIVWRYRIAFGASSVLAGVSDPATELRSALQQRFPEGGFLLRGHNDPAPGLDRAIGRFGGFLTLAGLSGLLMAGVGAANAVSAFVERKRRTIAACRTLGAWSGVIVRMVLLQTLLLAGAGALAGLCIGAALPALAGAFLGPLLPFHFAVGVYPGVLALAAAYGLLASLTFILWPLGRIQEIRAGELLRETASDRRPAPPWRFMAGSAACAAGLVGLALFQSPDAKLAAMACGGAGGVFALFWGIGRLMKVVARRVPRPSRPELALALASLGGPGSPAVMLSVSLGAGLTMLTAVAVVDASLTEELASEMPKRAPSHFFLGAPKAGYETLVGVVREAAPAARLERAPELRGRIVALAGAPVETIRPPKGVEWALNGDRGLTFAEAPPPGSQITAGAWWSRDYKGPPLVSFDEGVAKALKLRLGDAVTVNVLGRNLTASIANFRKVNWESLGINFVMIFSPDALAAAPYRYLVSLNWPEGAAPTPGEEAAVTRAVAAAFPSITIIRVRDALETVQGILAKVMAAIKAAGAVTLLLGGFVMAGALTAAGKRRTYQAVILKTLGAPPRRILASHVSEHLLLALVTAAVAAVLGSGAAYGVVTGVMDARLALSGAALLQALALGAIFALIVSAYDSYRALRAKAAPYLRAES